MTRSLRISPFRALAARAKRSLAALMALLLFVPVSAAAAPFPVMRDNRDMAEALGLFLRGSSSRKEGAQVGDWYLHPFGFAFVIPDGFVAQRPTRGTTVLLVEASGRNVPFRTTINIAVTKPDSGVQALTPQTVKSRYGASFSRFSLLRFSHETMYGTTGVRLFFFSGNAPKLLFEQRLFVKEGHSYVITLIAENHVRSLARALEQFDALCGSLIFSKDTESPAKK